MRDFSNNIVLKTFLMFFFRFIRDIFSDTICPWCYIGFNQLNQALENFNNYNFEIVWRPFQLNPEMPPDGMDRQQYLTFKFGSEDNARSVYQRIEDEGEKNWVSLQSY